MNIADFNPSVKINGTTINDWISFQTDTRLGSAETSFVIKVGRPMTISSGSTAKITTNLGTRGGVAGGSYVLVDDKEIESNVNDGSITTLYGTGSKLTRKSPSIMSIYVNRNWLNFVYPNYYQWQKWLFSEVLDGVPSKVNGVSDLRLKIEGLPGEEIKDSEFVTILTYGITHHNLGKMIAQACDLDLIVNTPDLPIQKTFWVDSKTPHWNALVSLFDMWRPHIFVRKNKVYVMDAGGDDQKITGLENISLTTDSFEGYTIKKEESENIVDHVIVRGPNVSYTYISENVRVRNKRRTQNLSCLGPEVTEVYEDIEEYSGSDPQELLLWQNSAIWKPIRTVRTITKRIDLNNPRNRVTTKEVLEEFNIEGTLMHKTEAEYQWASATQPIGQTVTQYALVGKVAGGYDESINSDPQSGVMSYQNLPSELELLKVSEKITEYRNYMAKYGQSESDTVEYALCCAYKSKYKYEGETGWGYDLVRPLVQAQQAGIFVWDENTGEGEDAEGWETQWRMIKKETVRFDKASGDMLRKHRAVTTMLPIPTTVHHYEDIPLPNESLRRNSRPEVPLQLDRRWEFFDVGGVIYLYDPSQDLPLPAGDYHPAEIISSPDVVDQSIATMIAQRRMRGKKPKLTLQIKTVFPIPSIQVGGTLTLPTCTKSYFDYTTKGWVDVSLSSATYWITGVSTVCNFTGQGDRADLEAYNVIELKDWY